MITRKLKIFLMITLFALIASQVSLFISTNTSFSIENIEKINEHQYQVNYSILSGQYQTEVNVVYFPINTNFENNLPIYILFDNSSKTYDIYRTWRPFFMIVIGLYNDLRYEARLRGYNGNINLVNSSELSRVFIENQKAIVIIPTVTWEVELKPPSIDIELMNSWVNNGGILIWLGAHPKEFSKLFFYDNNSGRKIVPISSRWGMTEATSDSKISRALNLFYGYVNLGASVDSLSLINGTVLGKIYEMEGREKRTSIALIPYGNGRIVIFGYGIVPPYHQRSVRRDIMQIIYSGILYVDGLVEYNSHSLRKKSKENGKILLDLNKGDKWVIFAFSKELYSNFVGHKEIMYL